MPVGLRIPHSEPDLVFSSEQMVAEGRADVPGAQDGDLHAFILAKDQSFLNTEAFSHILQLMQPSDFGSLAALHALLTEASVSGAAKRLCLSTPAMSHALNRLRDRFDDPLLVRAGRGMVLTPRAEALRPHVEDAVAAASLVFRPPEREELARAVRSYTLALSDYVTTLIGAGLDQSVRDQAPNVDLRFLLNAPDDPDRLRQGEVDVIVGIYGRLPPEVKRRRVVSDRLVTVVRRAHPKIGKRLGLRQYATLPHIQVAPRGRPGGVVDRRLAESGRRRRVARAVPFFRHALELVSETDYLLTVPERIATKFAQPLGLKLLEPPIPLEPYALSMVWHPRNDSDDVHRFLRQQLVACFESIGGVSHDV